MAKSKAIIEETFAQLGLIEPPTVGSFLQKQLSYDLNFNISTQTDQLHFKKQLKANG
jgi:hypothetical protein